MICFEMGQLYRKSAPHESEGVCNNADESGQGEGGLAERGQFFNTV